MVVGFDVHVTDAGRYIVTMVDGRAMPVTVEEYKERLSAKERHKLLPSCLMLAGPQFCSGRCRISLRSLHLPGCGTILRYGFTVFHPSGNFSLAASSDSAGTMMQSSPCCQFTGVAT